MTESTPTSSPSKPPVNGEVSDDELMIRVQSGETAAFETIVERYQGSLIGFFYRNTRQRELAEDLAQETLLKVYNQAWDYLPLGRFRGWLFRIARNLLIDDVRKRSHDCLVRAVTGSVDPERDDALARIAGDLLPPQEGASDREVAVALAEALEELPEDQRQTVTLHYYTGLPLPEVAEIMEATLSTCKSRLRLAREKLRRKLPQRGIGPSG